MFRVKICGVTAVADALTAVEAGADAVGVNFFRGSPRVVTRATAAKIARAVAGRALLVGVFVNERPEVIDEVCRDAGLSAVQLAGEEPADDAARIPWPRIKSVRPGPGRRLDAVEDYPCEAFLVDAGAAGKFGGTGRRLDWGALAGGEGAGRGGMLRGRPWILAGGLAPGNVAGAIRAAHPWGVDVASGVESAPGRKDRDKVRAFVAEAMEEFGRAES